VANPGADAFLPTQLPEITAAQCLEAKLHSFFHRFNLSPGHLAESSYQLLPQKVLPMF
jgi:hypothetical protein